MYIHIYIYIHTYIHVHIYIYTYMYSESSLVTAETPEGCKPGPMRCPYPYYRLLLVY